jgi:hypothetical protein
MKNREQLLPLFREPLRKGTLAQGNSIQGNLAQRNRRGDIPWPPGFPAPRRYFPY